MFMVIQKTLTPNQITNSTSSFLSHLLVNLCEHSIRLDSHYFNNHILLIPFCLFAWDT